jgi:hypothetical protein
LAAHGLHTGLVVDIGETSTRVTPVLNGHPLRHLMRRVSVGGKTLTERTLLHLVHDGYPFRSFAEPQRTDGYISGNTFLQRRVGQFVKQHLCCVKPHPHHPPHSSDNTSSNVFSHHYPDKVDQDKAINESSWPTYLQDYLKRQHQHEFVVWREARSEVTECLFVPHEAMSSSHTSSHSRSAKGALHCGDGTIHGLILNVLRDMSPATQRRMSSNIVLSGGTSLLPGLPERLCQELERAVGQAMGPVQIVAAPERDLAASVGASLLARNVDFGAAICATRQLYEDKGTSGVLAFCDQACGVLEATGNTSNTSDTTTNDTTTTTSDTTDTTSDTTTNTSDTTTTLPEIVRLVAESTTDHEMARRQGVQLRMVQALQTSLTSVLHQQPAELTEAQRETERMLAKWKAADELRCPSMAGTCKSSLARAKAKIEELERQLEEGGGGSSSSTKF